LSQLSTHPLLRLPAMHARTGGLGSQNPGQQLEELRGMLAGSTAKWKVVISHQ